MNTQYKNNLRSLSDDELRIKTYYSIIKSKQLKGYVRLNTNYGYLNLQIECDLAPKTSENFLELCESGYYNNLSFHRLVKGFVLQGGDPTANGSGGTSYYGKAFEDEFHPNLTHSCRGILSMANSGKHSNSSQFFVRLKSSPHLDNKHSVFGQVVGNIKVLDDIESIGSDSKGKPKTDIKILSTEVFSNPFRNIISDLIIKDLYLPGEAQMQSQIISDRVDANLKKLNDIAAGDLENNSEVGKYLNRKRKNNVDYKCLALGYYNDPYVYHKPNKIKFTSCNKFEFSDW